MNVDVHILAFNEAEILNYALRHYATFARSITIHDGGSTDNTADVAAKYGAFILPWDTKGEVNDLLYKERKNGCWKGTNADWVICADADELIYFPSGHEATLLSYEKSGAAVIKARGFEMFSDVYPTHDGQIYEQINMGAPDDFWYGKPLLFSPKRVIESGFGVGSHESEPQLADGRWVNVNRNWPKADPETYLLHYHQIGPIERIAARYDGVRSRMAQVQRDNNWGNMKDGMIHAQEKRDYIIPKLRRVV